jgi:hypothetical protein
MHKLREAASAAPIAKPLEQKVDQRIDAACRRLRSLYHLCAQIRGSKPYKIRDSEMLSVVGGIQMCSPVSITPTEMIMCYSYDHPEQDHIPDCSWGQQCIGASVLHGSTDLPFGLPLKSFRTRDTRSLVGMPAGMCILCITACQTVPAIGPRIEGGIAQVYCNSSSFGKTDPSRTVNGPGGSYLSPSFHDWRVEEIPVCGRIVHYVHDSQLFRQACREPGSCPNLIRLNTRHA